MTTRIRTGSLSDPRAMALKRRLSFALDTLPTCMALEGRAGDESSGVWMRILRPYRNIEGIDPYIKNDEIIDVEQWGWKFAGKIEADFGIVINFEAVLRALQLRAYSVHTADFQPAGYILADEDLDPYGPLIETLTELPYCGLPYLVGVRSPEISEDLWELVPTWMAYGYLNNCKMGVFDALTCISTGTEEQSFTCTVGWDPFSRTGQVQADYSLGNVGCMAMGENLADMCGLYPVVEFNQSGGAGTMTVMWGVWNKGLLNTYSEVIDTASLLSSATHYEGDRVWPRPDSGSAPKFYPSISEAVYVFDLAKNITWTWHPGDPGGGVYVMDSWEGMTVFVCGGAYKEFAQDETGGILISSIGGINYYASGLGYYT